MSIDDAKILKMFHPIRKPMLETTVEALKIEESLGGLALESLAELAKSHPGFFESECASLVHIVSEIVKMNSFEDGIRS